MIHKPEFYMHRALELATQAAELGEVPVGAVLVNTEGEIIGKFKPSAMPAKTPAITV